MVDNVMRALVGHERASSFRARGADYGQAGGMRHLHGRNPDAAACAMH